MAKTASVSSVTTSDWVHAEVPVLHRIDVDVDAGATVTYTIETTHDTTSGLVKTLPVPTDATTDWSLTGSVACTVYRGFYRLNVSAYAGTGDVIINIQEVESRR